VARLRRAAITWGLSPARGREAVFAAGDVAENANGGGRYAGVLVKPDAGAAPIADTTA
jgi:hypothetical protein